MRRKRSRKLAVVIGLFGFLVFVCVGVSIKQGEVPEDTEAVLKGQETVCYGETDGERGEESSKEDAEKTELKENAAETASKDKTEETVESLFTEDEKEKLRKTALRAAEEAADVYRDIERKEGASFASDNRYFTQEQCREMVLALGKAGFTGVTKNCNMENPEKIEAFYRAWQEKRDAEFTVFEPRQDGFIGAKTILCREGRLQAYYMEIGWKEGGVPEIRGTFVNDLREIKLTEKGYFIYQYEDSMPHSCLRQYWRVKPLSDRCRELTEKYIAGLSYVNYNMLVTDWDEHNAEDILMPCMFEDIYRMDTGENLRTKGGWIPADVYEEIMTAYFPVSVEQVRNCCGYDGKRGAYPYEMILGRQYPPFGEVVDYAENADGTITLTVDGVWADYNSDCAFRNTVVVREAENGRFRYLSNAVEERELAIPTSGGADGDVPAIAGAKKDYDLPISARERKRAEADCVRMMELVSDIYGQAEREELSDVILSDEQVFRMQDRLREAGVPVTTAVPYSDMENFERTEYFLKACRRGKRGSLTIYRVRYDGGIGLSRFVFDGKDMDVLTASAVWGAGNEPKVSYLSRAKIEKWDHTENGWFAYQVCVPAYPEVTEVVDGSCLIRVKPMKEENRELSEKCVKELGYSGNNLLCSDWDMDHMEGLDYNGMFEYLYRLKYRKEFPMEDYREGVAAKEFESLIMEYLPVTAEQIREYAAFDEKEHAYGWGYLRGGSYVLHFFETSLPEVTDVRENGDGTLTLTVHGVCDTVICDDAVIVHELTVRFAEDGSFRYLGNRILRGAENVPEYQYRIPSADSTDRAISEAPAPFAFSSPAIFTAKKQVSSSVSTNPINHPLESLPSMLPVPVFP